MTVRVAIVITPPPETAHIIIHETEVELVSRTEAEISIEVRSTD